jgi:hypothetical protein
MNDENMDGWMRVTKGYGKCARKLVAKQAQIIPTCVNRFVVPSNLKGSAEQLKEQERINVRLMETSQKGNLKKKHHKVVVVGDSHARGCATKLIDNLGEAFEVTGFVKPGTGLEVITTMESEGISKLTKKDVEWKKKVTFQRKRK